MRLDKYLKVSRIIKRRTMAGEACDKQRVYVNGNPAKSGKQIKPDDIIEILFGEKKMKLKVLAVNETVRKDDASSMYEVIS